MPVFRSLWNLGVVGFFLAFAGSAPASQYVAWSAGDNATYRDMITGSRIRAEAAQGGRLWVHYTNFAGLGPLWINSSGRSERVYVQGTERRTQLFADFGAPLGTSTPLDLGPCNRGAAILASRDTLTVPAGAFADVVRVDFETSCADAGVTSAWFAPGVGPIQWTAVTIAGPSTYQMISASIGGIPFPRHSGVALHAEFPEPIVWIDMMPVTPKPARIVNVYLTIQNNTTEELTYSFTTGQHFEIEVVNAAGQVVARWSRDKAFTQAFNDVTIAPGAGRRFGGSLKLAYDDERPLAQGQYTLRIYLTNENPPGVTPPQSAAPLEIRWAF